MKRSYAIGIIGFIILVVCGWWFWSITFGNVELNSKVEWSMVERVVAEHKGKPYDKVEVIKMDEHSFVGIPVQDGRNGIWIMLNAHYSPYYKQIPSGNYTLTQEDLKRILAFGAISSTVANCLESHIEGITNTVLPMELFVR